MTKRVLALQHIWDDPTGYIGEILEEHDIACTIVQVDTEPLPDPKPYDALIVFGGVQHANDDDKYPYFIPEKALLSKAIEHEMPFLGICLGGQLLAHVLGGKVRRHSFTEIGFFDIPFTPEGQKDPLYQGLPGYQKVFHWHEDVFDVPSNATLLASTEVTPNQAFRYRKHIYGLQYHIELTHAMLDIWLHDPAIKQELVNTVGNEVYSAIAEEQEKQFPVYQQHSRIMFENFLRIAGLI